jgi:hypothetical protein
MFWLATFREAAEAGQSMIFTFAPEATVAPDFPHRAKALIKERGGEMALVRLTVTTEEQERRIVNADRGQFGKLRSLEILHQLRDQFLMCESAMPPPELNIDTSQVQPDDAACSIAAAFGL